MTTQEQTAKLQELALKELMGMFVKIKELPKEWLEAVLVYAKMDFKETIVKQ
jgi:hypothetical protein